MSTDIVKQAFVAGGMAMLQMTQGAFTQVGPVNRAHIVVTAAVTAIFTIGFQRLWDSSTRQQLADKVLLCDNLMSSVDERTNTIMTHAHSDTRDALTRQGLSSANGLAVYDPVSTASKMTAWIDAAKECQTANRKCLETVDEKKAEIGVYKEALREKDVETKAQSKKIAELSVIQGKYEAGKKSNGWLW